MPLLTQEEGQQLYTLFYTALRNVSVNTSWVERQVAIKEHILHLLDTPRYSDPRRLQRFENQVHSQNGEDGIVAEIFKRIGTRSKVAFELACGDGLENNTTFLLLSGWRNYWCDYNPKYVEAITKNFGFLYGKQLTFNGNYVTPQNLEENLKAMMLPAEVDFASFDIDGNDYWVVKRFLELRRPRVFAVEYGAIFPPPVEFIMPLKGRESLDKFSMYHSASLESMVKMAKHFGFIPVGCELTGANAFFVAEEYAGSFCPPFTAENHWEPPRFYLAMKIGHERGFGSWVTE